MESDFLKEVVIGREELKQLREQYKINKQAEKESFIKEFSEKIRETILCNHSEYHMSDIGFYNASVFTMEETRSFGRYYMEEEVTFYTKYSNEWHAYKKEMSKNGIVIEHDRENKAVRVRIYG